MNMLIDSIEKYAIGPVKMIEPMEVVGKFSFDNDFKGFSGHFPGYPILPAVLQLFIAQLLVEKQRGQKIKVTSIKKAKFLSQIRPDDEITVRCADASSDELTRSKVSITEGDRLLASFIMNYTA